MGMGSSGGKGGGQATSNGQPVYYDSVKGQYYTMSSPSIGGLGGIFPWAMLGKNSNADRNYLGSSLNQGNMQQTSVNPNVYNQSYSNYPQPNTTGAAFDNGVNSDSGIAAILAGLYNSGVFNQQQVNPYAPNGTVGSWTGIPYGQQQESMFSRQNLNGRPHGGYQGQNWNPYGQYYTASNNNVAPPPGTTGPDALQQLSFMSQNQNQNAQI